MADSYTRAANSLAAGYAQQTATVDREQQMRAQRLQARAESAQRAEESSPWGKIGELLSSGGELIADAWTDDFSAFPVVGPMASGAASLYHDATTGINQIGSSAALAANPNYRAQRGLGNLYGDSLQTSAGRSIVGAADAAGLGLGIYDRNPGFDISDPTAQEQEFGDGWGRVITGAVDGAYTWFLDPFVLAGKAIKVARFGTTAMGLDIVGTTSRRIAGTKIISQLEAEADSALSGRVSTLGYEGEVIARSDYTDLLSRDIFQGSNRDLLATIGHHIDNRDDAVVFLAAAAGSKRYQERLRVTQTNVFATLQRHTGMENPYESAILNRPMGSADPAILPELLDKGIKAEDLVRDLAKRDKALHDAIAGIDEQPLGLLERAGSRSVEARKIADAWRAGKDARKTMLKREVKDASRLGTGPAAYERIFQLSSAAPRIRVWEWLGGYHASGYIDIKGWNNGKASDELVAALTDSKVIRKDGAFIREQLNIFGAATNPDARMEAIRTIEKNVMLRMGEHYGVKDLKRIEEVYRTIDRRRFEVVDQFHNRAYGVLDDGDVVKTGPMLTSQLETSMPMLDFTVLDKSVRIAAKPHYNMTQAEYRAMGTQAAKNLADEIQSLWKAGVLLRLGYTMRNTTEGWLRSAAFLGTIPALKHPLSATRNSFYNNSRRARGKVPGRGTRATMRDQDEAVKGVLERRALLEEKIAERNAALAANPLTRTGDMDRSINNLRADLGAIEEELARLTARRENLAARRFIGDDAAFAGKWTGKVDGKKRTYDLDFEHGDLVRKLSSADKTTENFLMSAWMRGDNARLNSNNWVKVSPDKPQYWQELSGAVRQFRNDPLALQILEGKTTGELVAWTKSPASRAWRRDLNVPHAASEGKVVQMQRMIEEYLPTAEARAAAAKGELDAAQLQLMLGNLAKAEPLRKAPVREGYTTEAGFKKAMAKYEEERALYVDSATLKPIHGREAAQVTSGATIYGAVYRKPIDKLFEALGTYPESALVRHPFYAEVWQRRMNMMVKQAQAQGRTVDTELLTKINTSAHRAAMRATNETLYTIERYSNLASVMRWAAPFFAAWENSARVWTRLVVNDPSIAARASILWQIPNRLGMVVDENGEKVTNDSPLSFLTGSQNRFVVVPQEFSDAIDRVSKSWAGDLPGPLGGIVRGAAAFPLKVPQGALNVVTPGETPWLPGLGPLVTIPVAKYLATKPDVQKFAREFLGDAVYNQFVPFGVPNDSVVEGFVPPWVRKYIQDWKGEGSQEWKGVADAMMQNAMVGWYKSGGRPEDKPDMNVVLERAHDFYKFSMLASLTLPFATTRMSPYQQQVDYWNNMKADASMTYSEKVEAFVKKWGEDFIPLTVGSGQSDVQAVDPTIEDYNMLRDNADLARELADLDPAAVALLAASAPVGEFDKGVYEWLQNENVPGSDSTYRGRRNPAEMQTATIMASAWRDYRKAKAERDAALLAVGAKTIQDKDAAHIAAGWKQFLQDMNDEYGDPWRVEFNTYTNQSALYLTGIQNVLENETFMSKHGDTPLWQGVSTYMDVRNQALAAIDSGVDGTEVRKQFAAWAAEYQYSSLEFSDFFDRFLAQDQMADYGLETING